MDDRHIFANAISKTAWVPSEIFEALKAFRANDTLVISAFILTNFTLDPAPGKGIQTDYHKTVFKIVDTACCGVDLSVFTLRDQPNVQFPLDCEMMVEWVEHGDQVTEVGVVTLALTTKEAPDGAHQVDNQ